MWTRDREAALELRVREQADEEAVGAAPQLLRQVRVLEQQKQYRGGRCHERNAGGDPPGALNGGNAEGPLPK